MTEAWSEFTPILTGQQPSGYTPGDEVEMQINFGTSWKRLKDEPLWSSVFTYRWRPSRKQDLPAPVSSTGGSLPDDAAARLEYPMADGLLDYFPNALAEVARLSYVATQQHHPDQPMHWDRGKSTDHRNKIMRHLIDTGKVDDKGMRHSAMVAWRALALLQQELEDDTGVPMSRASRPPE